MVITGVPSALENSVFIKHKLICVAVAAVCATIGVTLSGLSIGLGADYSRKYNCDDCCHDDNHCMVNLGYACRNEKCVCDFTSMNATKSLDASNLTAEVTLCGAYNWTCTSNSDCRDVLGLICDLSSNNTTFTPYTNAPYTNTSTRGMNTQNKKGVCRCPSGYYYDRILKRCMFIKGYLQSCTGNSSEECDHSKNLICNTNNNYTCDCPSTSVINTCDCPLGYFYDILSNACALLRGYLEQCTGVNFDECDYNQNLFCDKRNFTCNCPDENYYYDFTFGTCVLYRDYTETCWGGSPCNPYKNLTCSNAAYGSGCNCPQAIGTNQCDCQNGFYHKNSTCVLKLPTGFACTANYMCSNGTCSSGFCN